MSYPNQIDQFPVKLNKKTDGSVYVVEEELLITAGKYEGLLDHDNITNTSIRVYTGSKLTGEEITNYIVSVPSETPWRRHIKVFASVPVVYVTYETPGDTVEAADVNELQVSMTATQTEIDRYKAANDAVVNNLDSRFTTHENNKNNPHTVTVAQIGAETPAGAQTKADAAKAAAISTAAQDATAKANTAQSNAIAAAALDATAKANAVQANLDTHTANKNNPHVVTVAQIGAETPAGAQAKADTAKTAAIAAAATDATSKANAVQANLNTHGANVTDAHNVANRMEVVRLALITYIDQSIAAVVNGATEMLDTLYELSNALGNDPNFSATMTNLIGQKLAASEVVATATANKVLRLDATSKFPATVIAQTTANRFVTDAEKAAWVTQSQLAAAGYGDMLKSIYDTNNNGKVDAAETADAVPWSGVSGKPSTYTPSAHTHTALSPSADNYKDAAALPSAFERGITVFFSNNPTNKFNGLTYGTIMTIKGYSNMACVQYIYPYNVDVPISYRYALYNSDSWLPWRTLLTTESVLPTTGVTWNQLKGV